MSNLAIKERILEQIRAHDTIIVSRHKRPDGDAVGSTTGLVKILRLSYPEKRIFLDNNDFSEYVSFLCDETAHPADADYEHALVIVVDTGTADRISNPHYDRGDCLIKIDHHIDDKPFGDISWVEEERSSACEMIVDFCMSFPDELKLNADAATSLYTGMVTDSGRFRFRGTDGNTLRYAAALLDTGIDTENIYARLYMEDPEIKLFHAALISRVRFTENGVAYLHISRAMRHRRKLSMEDAGNVVSLMEGIKGCLIWIAFIENDDNSIRVRLRSRFVEVQELATRYHGGGHACASGATVYSKEEKECLLSDADTLLGQYKSSHTDWV